MNQLSEQDRTVLKLQDLPDPTHPDYDLVRKRRQRARQRLRAQLDGVSSKASPKEWSR